MPGRGRILTPMELAGTGLDKAGRAAEEGVQLLRHVMPQWYDLAERAVVAGERLASAVERLAGPEEDDG